MRNTTTRPNTSPTRMERTRQKSREKTARRGHKLLKDKSDEMLRNFMHLSRENTALRKTVEDEITRALRLFATARVHMTAVEIENAVAGVQQTCEFVTSTQNIMGLHVPRVTLHAAVIEPHKIEFLTTHQSFDRAVSTLQVQLMRIVELANLEKALSLLASEIGRLRRRINALEHSVIPQIVDTIDYITMRLDENERSNQVRLMKVKEILAETED